jgi:SAM-dependent methyltransferase
MSAISLSAFYNTAYVGIPPSVLTQAISALPIRYEDFTFIDHGCGKGHALLVAAQFPFRRLLGVEIASELCDIARANVDTSPEWAARISIANQDATSVAYPDGPLILFFYDPFLPPVLRRVLANLERHLRRSPRPTYLLYAGNPRNPRFKRVMDSFAFLSERRDTVYALSPEDAAQDPLHLSEESFTLYSAEIAR